eukprot:TRINITY_DN22935_c0_g1_i1.p3 TRINITY_DN22935_c0_g1~~TRINITY_DN22935_c0_g1_i1.p3  ORF type:complete len:100 (-),score=33.66 TRINITY_DN22935_c0_g1_i1:264-563(-)
MIRRPPRSTLSSSSAASDVYKRQEQMMGKYRTKLSSDERKREEVLKGREEEQLRGSAFDYKRSSVDGNRAKVYSRGTDDVGNAISADCYQSYTSKDKGW